MTDQPHVLPLAYDVPDAIFYLFSEAFEAAIGDSRDGPTLVAQAMNVVDRLMADGQIARQNYEAIVRPLMLVKVAITRCPVDYSQVGYQAYAKETGGKTFDGRDMPAWSDLPEHIQQAWAAAASAIRRAD